MATHNQYQRIILYKKPLDKKFYISKLQVLEQRVINLKKRLIFALFLILLILISGCKGKKDVKKSLEEIRTGTEGIVMSFLPNAPPDKIHVEEGPDNSFEVVLEVRNKGAYPQPEEGGSPSGKIFLSGFDANILKFDKDSTEEIKGKALDGKSTINPNGGLDLITFKGNVDFNYLNVEKYEPTIMATVCYHYDTVASPSVCIDPNPYSTTNEKKVCQVNDITLSNQGAPIAVTRIDEEAFAKKTQFKITIKNSGGGDVLDYIAISNCGPKGQKITREDIDKVRLLEAKVGNNPLECGPFITKEGSNFRGRSGDFRLINGEGFLICEFTSREYANNKNAYLTPIKIRLFYGYRNTAEKKIQIKKETSGLGGGSDTSQPQQSNIQIEEPFEPYE